jgi:hypothetical protein
MMYALSKSQAQQVLSDRGSLTDGAQGTPDGLRFPSARTTHALAELSFTDVETSLTSQTVQGKPYQRVGALCI